MASRAGRKPKRRSTNRAKRGATKAAGARQRPSGWFWLSTGLAVGLLVALLVYLRSEPSDPIPPRAEAPSQETRDAGREDREAPVQPLAPSGADREPEEDSGPRFEFYSMLPELEVVVPDSPAPEPEAGAVPDSTVPEPEAAPAPATGARYMLQAGSFRSHDQADRQKASLALLGVSARVEEVIIDDQTWHRVRIGPFDEMDRLNDTRRHLEEHGVDAVLLKVSG